MSLPPPLPWEIRARPEKMLLLCSASLALLGGLWCAGNALGWTGSVCAWKAGTNLPCAGCGTTRAMLLLAGGQWSQALVLNPAAVLFVPLLVAANLYAIAVLALRLEPWRPAFLRGGAWRWAAASVVLANWLYLLAAGRA